MRNVTDRQLRGEDSRLISSSYRLHLSSKLSMSKSQFCQLFIHLQNSLPLFEGRRRGEVKLKSNVREVWMNSCMYNDNFRKI